jgi:prephenate dehydratase
MSLTSQLLKNQITAEEFAVKAAADVFKAVKWFQAIPGVIAVENWLLGKLQVFIAASAGDLFAVNVIDLVKTELAKLTAPPAA